MAEISEKKVKEYEEYVKEVTPTTSLAKNMLMAFIVGGIICVIGQFLIDFFLDMGYDEKKAAMAETIVMVLGAAILTGTGVYAKLAKYGGAGTLVPITGFANSVASSAIEFLPEGQVFGIGCRIFQIAGPVILYGIFSSWVLGLIYWILKMMNVM